MKWFSIQKIIFAIFILVVLILVGCSPSCPESCDDGDNCTEDFCSNETDFNCVNQPIVPCDNNGICEEGEFLKSDDCPTCNDNNSCTEDIYDFSTSSCQNVEIIPCLGNGICEEGEYPSEDCPDCDDDNECTEDSYDYSLKNCSNKIIIPCCGNDICDEGENYSVCSDDCEMTKEEAIVDCKEEKLDIVESCLTDVAIKYEDYNVCEEINETKERLMTYTTTLIDRCLKTVAIALKNEKICEEISDQADDEPDNCYHKVATAKGDYNLCTKSGFVKHKTIDCFKDVYISLGGRSYSGTICGGLKDDYYKLCMGVINSNDDYCEGIDSSSIRDECNSNT